MDCFSIEEGKKEVVNRFFGAVANTNQIEKFILHVFDTICITFHCSYRNVFRLTLFLYIVYQFIMQSLILVQFGNFKNIYFFSEMCVFCVHFTSISSYAFVQTCQLLRSLTHKYEWSQESTTVHLPRKYILSNTIDFRGCQ